MESNVTMDGSEMAVLVVASLVSSLVGLAVGIPGRGKVVVEERLDIELAASYMLELEGVESWSDRL